MQALRRTNVASGELTANYAATSGFHVSRERTVSTDQAVLVRLSARGRWVAAVAILSDLHLRAERSGLSTCV